MAFRPGAVFISPLLILVLACVVAPVPTRSPGRSPGPTPSISISLPTPTVRPGPTPDPALHVDGMATVAVAVSQVVDPAHPNHNRALNAQLGTIDAGERIYLVDNVRVKGVSYWEVATGSYAIGPLGWVPEVGRDATNLEPYLPACPTEFPLAAATIASLESLETLSCFGGAELTLTGTLNCDRAIGDFIVGGSGFPRQQPFVHS